MFLALAHVVNISLGSTDPYPDTPIVVLRINFAPTSEGAETNFVLCEHSGIV